MKKTKIISVITLFSILLMSCSPKENSDVTNEKLILEETRKELQTIKETDVEIKDETIKETIKETINEEESESEKETDKETKKENDKIRIGSKIEIKKDFHIYGTASNAKNKINSTKVYNKGIYFAYKIVNDAINLSKSQNVPGGWVNYEELGIDVNDIPEEDFADRNHANLDTNKEIQETKKEAATRDIVTNSKQDILNAIKESNINSKPYEWSYAYPSNLDLLKKYNGYNIKNSGRKSLYLTFDNGYEYKNNTTKILDILNKNGIKATFFTTGPFIRQHPDVARRIINEGHNLSNHSEKHINQAKSSASDVYDDIKNWETTVTKVIKSNNFSKLMRPPEGAYSETSLFIANKLGYKTIFWNYAYGDWDTSNQPDPYTSLQKLLNHNKDGSIILLHAVSDTNVEILEQYIKESKKEGYSFRLL